MSCTAMRSEHAPRFGSAKNHGISRKNARAVCWGTMKANYRIDPAHSNAQFSVRHMMISNVRGGFNGVQGTMTYDPETRAITSVDATIDAGTIKAGCLRYAGLRAPR